MCGACGRGERSLVISLLLAVPGLPTRYTQLVTYDDNNQTSCPLLLRRASPAYNNHNSSPGHKVLLPFLLFSLSSQHYSYTSLSLSFLLPPSSATSPPPPSRSSPPLSPPSIPLYWSLHNVVQKRRYARAWAYLCLGVCACIRACMGITSSTQEITSNLISSYCTAGRNDITIVSFNSENTRIITTGNIRITTSSNLYCEPLVILKRGRGVGGAERGEEGGGGGRPRRVNRSN